MDNIDKEKILSKFPEAEQHKIIILMSEIDELAPTQKTTLMEQVNDIYVNPDINYATIRVYQNLKELQAL